MLVNQCTCLHQAIVTLEANTDGFLAPSKGTRHICHTQIFMQVQETIVFPIEELKFTFHSHTHPHKHRSLSCQWCMFLNNQMKEQQSLKTQIYDNAFVKICFHSKQLYKYQLQKKVQANLTLYFFCATTFIHSFIHSFSNLSDDRSNASSKMVPPHSAI